MDAWKRQCVPHQFALSLLMTVAFLMCKDGRPLIH